MKASIIIVSQNDEKHILNLLESLSFQDFKDFEVLLVDLCSTDQTLARAKSFPVKAFRLETSEKNIPKAINSAARLCAGEVIFCLRGNVIPKNINFISSGLKTFTQKKTALVFGPRIKMDEAPLVKLLNFRVWGNIDFQSKEILPKEIKFIHLDACAFRKKYWKIDRFPENEVVSVWEWSQAQLELEHKIIFNPQMAAVVQDRTGLIKYLGEKTRINRLYHYFRTREKR